MEFLIVLVILGAVVVLVSWPLWRRDESEPEQERHELSGSVSIAELEADREAKYREIRDAELDHRTGKLSDADFEAIDHALRGDAIEIMHALDRVRAAEADSSSYHRAG